MLRFVIGLFCALLLAAGPVSAQDSTPRSPVMVEGKSSLPLRVLTRPMSNLYQTADEQSTALQSNLPTFTNFFVYTQPQGEQAAVGAGWYEVGTDDKGKVVGWVRGTDVFEWKQTMCLAYTTPVGRSPVMMFENRQPLDDLIKKTPEERAAEAKKLYDSIDSQNIAADFPVISVEPKLAVDIAKEFYLLPILDFQAIEVDNRQGRLLELAAVVTSGEESRTVSDIRTNEDFLTRATETALSATEKTGENLMVDFVWVMDTTLSMAPYIEEATKLVKNVSERINQSQPDLKDRLKFGIWGYRDPVEGTPGVEGIAGIEYLTRNYTEQLQNVDDFVKTLAEVKETKVDSVDFPEDVFSGVNDAIYKSAWRKDALKIIVLVGDAPSHEMGHKWNMSGKDAEALRIELNENKVTFIAVQIRPKGAKRFQAVAQDQFNALSGNKGADKPAYIDVNAGDLSSFNTASNLVVNSSMLLIQSALEQAKGDAGQNAAEPGTAQDDPTAGEPQPYAEEGKADPLQSPAEGQKAEAQIPAGATALEAGQPPLSGEMAALLEDEIDETKLTAKEKEFKAIVQGSLQAALVDWLGSAAKAQAPRDIVAWVVDKDLIDSNRSSLEVRLLINKRQLDSLRKLLTGVIEAGRLSTINSDDLFTSLKAASSIVVRDPDKLSQAATLEKSGLIPEFLEGLPYESRLMSMSNDLWNSMSPDDQDNLINNLSARLAAYQTIHDTAELWVALNEGDEADEMVYPMPLDLLP